MRLSYLRRVFSTLAQECYLKRAADGDGIVLDIHVVVNSLIWKKTLARQTNLAVSLARDFELKKGGRIEFTRFLMMFRPKSS